MENSGSSSRKISPQEPKRGRIEYQDHEEPNLDLTFQLGSSRTVQNQRAQIQAPAAEDKIAKLDALRAELERVQDENRLLKEKLNELNMEAKALQDRTLSYHKPDENGEEEQGGAAGSPSSSDGTLTYHDPSSPSLSFASVNSDNGVLAGATISSADPFPTVMDDFTRPPPAVAATRELIKAIFTDPRVKAALVSAINAFFSVPKGKGKGKGKGDGDSQENGKKE